MRTEPSRSSGIVEAQTYTLKPPQTDDTMLSRTLLPFLTLLPTSLALTHGPQAARKFSCGEINVLFTFVLYVAPPPIPPNIPPSGLPPYHPLVKAQGADPAQVDAALRADADNIRKQGYNLRGTPSPPPSPPNTHF